MPSQRLTFFTKVDEVNLSDALKERFPGILFEDYDFFPDPDIRFIENIEAAEGREVAIFIPPKGWQPRFKELQYHPGKHGVANYPKKWMRYLRSRCHHMSRNPVRDGEPPMLHQGALQIGKSNRMTSAEVSLRNKVWRIMCKVATSKLRVRGDWRADEPWSEMGGQTFWAGWDAVRWALENENRLFKGSLYFRPADGVMPPAT